VLVVRGDEAIGSEEPRGVSRRFEALYPSPPLAGGPMWVRGVVVHGAMLAMFHVGAYLTLRRSSAAATRVITGVQS